MKKYKYTKKIEGNNISFGDVFAEMFQDVFVNGEEFEELKDESDLEHIQKKKYITVEEFAEIYNISKRSQQTKRNRQNNPLPYHQEVENGKITYNVDEVEKWRENGYK